MSHHFVPECYYIIVCAFVNLFASFTHIRSRNDNCSSQITKFFKAFLISDCVLLEVACQHSLKARVLISFNKMLVYIECNSLDSSISRGKSLDRTPLVFEIYSLSIVELFCYLVKPKIYIRLIHVLLNKFSFINKRNYSFIVNTVLDSVFVYQLTELLHGVLFAFHERSSGKSNITCIREYNTHLSCKSSVIRAMALINQNEHITRSVFKSAAFNCVKLVNYRSDYICRTTVNEFD